MHKWPKTQRNINGNSKNASKRTKRTKILSFAHYFILYKKNYFTSKRLFYFKKNYFLIKYLHQKDYFYFHGQRKTSCVQNGPFYCVW